MYDFRFIGYDIDKGKFSLKVRGADKAQAIAKAFALCKKRRLDAGLNWRCEFTPKCSHTRL